MNLDLQTELKKYFGFSNFLPGQEEAIQSILNGKHTLAVMPTGSGKSLIFQLAAMFLPGITLVISPLIALMKDQVDSLVENGISATYINSSIPSVEQKRRLSRISNGEYKLVYLAPERLRNTNFLDELKNVKVSLLAVDEAHCVSEWGHDFRPDYLRIANFQECIGWPITIALTATATPQVQTDIVNLLKLDKVNLIVKGFNRPNLILSVIRVFDEDHRLSVLRDSLISQPIGATIIYTGKRSVSEKVANLVSSELGISTRFYHAGLKADQRSEIQNEFIHGKIPIIVATNAFGMGINRSDVRQVIHFSLPGSLEAYYQEAGRAGRDGIPAKALLLYSNKDRALQEYFIRTSEISKSELLKIYNVLKPNNDQEILITHEELCKLTGLDEVKIKVGLSKLEHERIIDNFGYKGSYLNLKKNIWMERRVNEAMQRFRKQQLNKQQQLQSMVEYAESDKCRRNIILHYFGDKSYVTVDVCCDNCNGRKVTSKSRLTTAQQFEYDIRPKEIFADPSLIILETIQQIKKGVGSVKIAQILKGSKNKELQISKLNSLPQFGKLSGLRIGTIRSMIKKLIYKGYINDMGGQYPILKLTHVGIKALEEKTFIQLNTIKSMIDKKPNRNVVAPPISETIDQTFQLFKSGLTVDQIANYRGISVNTIYGHMVNLVKCGFVEVNKILPESMIKTIESAIVESVQVDQLAKIKAILPEEIQYNQIRCVVENWKRNNSGKESTNKIVVQEQAKYRKKNLEFIVMSGNNKDERAIPELIVFLKSNNGNQRRLAASALGKIGNSSAAIPLMDLIKIEVKPQVRQYAVKALGLTGDLSVISFLKQVESNQTEKDYVRKAAKLAINNIRSRNGNYKYKQSD